MDKLGEGAYGIVYQARGNHTSNQIRKAINYMPSKRLDYKTNKKVSHLPPYEKFPYSKN